MKSFLQTIAVIVIVCVLVDVIGFLAWAFSGQTPPDTFFIGSTTRSLIAHFIN